MRIARRFIKALAVPAIWALALQVGSAQTMARPVATTVDPGDADAVLAYASELRKQIDRSQFDIEALLEHLDFDETRIVRFVREEIAFEAYAGALRGPRGTLISRAGNMLDKSLLMARLLTDAGLDTRIGQALDTPSWHTSAASEVDASRGRSSGADLEQTTEHAEALAISSRIHALLQPDHEARLLERASQRRALALRDLYWVEFRESADDDWQRVSVVPEADSVIGSAKALRRFSGSVPPELVHRLRVELFLVKRDSTGESLTAIADPVDIIPANRALHTLTMQIASSRMLAMETATKPPDNQIIDVFMPVFDGKPMANGFDANGLIVPIAEASSSMAGIFASGASLGRRAADALGAAGKTAPSGVAASRVVEVPGFSAVRAVFTLLEPGGIERREQRDIVNADWLPKDNQADYNAAFYGWLTRHFTIGIATGAIGDAFLLDDLIERVEARTAAVRRFAPEAGERKRRRQEPLDPASAAWLPMNVQLRLIDLEAHRTGQYRDAPAVLVRSLSQGFGDFGREATDVVFSPRQSTRDDSLRHRLQAGVWESLVEGALLTGPDGIRSALDADYSIVKTDKLVDLGEVQSLLQRQMLADLARGNLVIAHPADVSKPRDSANYWRVTPLGEVVRIGTFGEGSQLGERAVIDQVIPRLMCASIFFGICTQAFSLAKPIAVVATIGTNADEIQFLLMAANTISAGLGGPSVDIPETAPTDGIILYGAAGAAERLNAAQQMLRRRCMENAMKTCGR